MQTQRVPDILMSALDRETSPMAWLEIQGELSIEDGITRFTPR